jgi:hypothetical protein
LPGHFQQPVPIPGNRVIYVSYKFIGVFFAAYLGDSVRPAPVADLSYSETINQQSYQQLLWETPMNWKNYPAVGILPTSFHAERSHMTFKLVRSMNEPSAHLRFGVWRF